MAKPTTVVSPRVAADVSVDINSVAANTSADETVTVKGLRKGGPVIAWTEDALDAGVSVTNFHASAKDTLKFRVLNTTSDAVDPTTLTLRVVQF